MRRFTAITAAFHRGTSPELRSIAERGGYFIAQGLRPS